MKSRDPYFTRLGVMLTEKCNIQCRHCLFSFRPNVGHTLEWAAAKRLILESRALNRIEEIHFTGGEPFLEFGILTKAVNLCRQLRVKASVATNGFWAVDLEKAKSMLGRLHGLDSLSVSADEFHQEFVPIQRVRGIIKTCQELGIKCSVQVCYLNDHVEETKVVEKQLSDLAGTYEICAYPVQHRFGTTPINVKRPSRSYDPSSMFCRSADNPVVKGNGDVIGCRGAAASWTGNHSLLLGNFHDLTLKEIMNVAELNPVIHALRLLGPFVLFRRVQQEAKKDGISIKSPSDYEKLCICSFCERMICEKKSRKYLQQVASERKFFHEIAAIRLIELAESSMILKEDGLAD